MVNCHQSLSEYLIPLKENIPIPIVKIITSPIESSHFEFICSLKIEDFL